MTAFGRGFRRGFILGHIVGIPALLVVMLLQGCPKPGPVPNGPDAAPAATCGTACDNLDRLGCFDVNACLSACQKVQRVSYRACLAAARSCGAASACDE